VVICVIALLAIAVGGWMATSRGPTPRPDRPALMMLGSVVAAEGLGAAAAGFGDVWIDDRAHGRLLRLDARRGKVTARVRVDGRLALGGGRVRSGRCSRAADRGLGSAVRS
jgi:hypothetical protein